MASSTSDNKSDFDALLDSDDEFPSHYNETRVIPAYEDDGRFFPIEFKWLNEQNKSTSQSLNNDSRMELISHGYLSEKDLICVKAVAGNLSNDMFLWFLDYLVRKDLQSTFEKPHIGCLVEKFPGSMIFNEENNVSEEKHCNSKDLKFELVVKSKISPLIFA